MPRRLGAIKYDAGCLELCSKTENGRCDEGCTSVLFFDILCYITVLEQKLVSQVRLAISGL